MTKPFCSIVRHKLSLVIDRLQLSSALSPLTPTNQSTVNMSAPAAKRSCPTTSPSLLWFDEKPLPNGKQEWACRVRNCRQPPYPTKSTSNFIRHLGQHEIDPRTITPFTHPALLRESVRASVIAMAAPAHSSSNPASASAIAAALDLPPPAPLLSSQLSVSSQASTSSLSS